MTQPIDYEPYTLKYYKKDSLDKLIGNWGIPEEDSVLYLGCGRASSLIPRPNWRGVDFNPVLEWIWKDIGVDKQCSVFDLTEPWPPEWGFDWTVSSNFFEHLPPKCVDHVIKQSRLIAPHGRHYIDRNLTKFKGHKGQSLHTALYKEDEWVKLWEKTGPVEFIHSNMHTTIIY